MAIIESIKKIFTKDADQDLSSTPEAVEETTSAADSSKPVAKPKHGEDGVCCGGCS